MLQEASDKCVYRDLTEHTLGENPDDLPQRFKNQHDFVTCAGLINNNHQDYLIFEEMLLSCKKGGYVIFAARYSMMGKYWYDNIIKKCKQKVDGHLLLQSPSLNMMKFQKSAMVGILRLHAKFLFSKTVKKK